MSGRRLRSSSCARVGAASRLCDPISVMISPTRGNQVGKIARSERAGRHAETTRRCPIRRPDPRPLDRGASEFRIGGNLAQHLLGRGRDIIDDLGHPHRETIGELELGLRANHRLLHDVGIPPGGHHGVVGVTIRIDEDAIARHLDIVEDHESVLLVEAARQRMVEQIRPGRAAIAANELQPGRVHWNAERQRHTHRRLRAAASRDRRRSRRQTAPGSRGCARRAR